MTDYAKEIEELKKRHLNATGPITEMDAVATESITLAEALLSERDEALKRAGELEEENERLKNPSGLTDEEVAESYRRWVQEKGQWP